MPSADPRTYRGYVFTPHRPEALGRGPRALLWKVTREPNTDGVAIALTFKHEGDTDAALDAIIARIESSLNG